MDIGRRTPELLNLTSQLLGLGAQISGDLYKAQAVEQYNKWQVFQAQIEEQANRDREGQQYEVPIEPDPHAAESMMGVGTTVLKRFGELGELDLVRENNKVTDAQIKWINETMTNKDARDKALVMAEIGSSQNLGKLRARWMQAAQHEFGASLKSLTKTVMESDKPWEQKVAEIDEAVSQGIAVGRMYADVGVTYMQEVIGQAQTSSATSGTMKAMDAGGLEAGEDYLNKNTPFWNDNPDKRAKVLDDVRREWLYDANTHDNAISKVLEQPWLVNIDNRRGLETLRDSLLTTEFKLPGNKEKWTNLITSRIDELKRRESTGDPGADKETNGLYARRWMMIKDSATRSVPLRDSIPGFKVGEIVAPDKAFSWLYSNMGADPVSGQPRIAVSYGLSEAEAIRKPSRPEFDLARSVYINEMNRDLDPKNLKPKHTPAWWIETQGNIEKRAAEESWTAKEFGAAVSAALTGAAIPDPHAGDMPAGQRLGGGVRTMDNTESFLWTWSQGGYKGYKIRSDVGEMDVALDKIANQLADRCAQMLGVKKEDIQVIKTENADVIFNYKGTRYRYVSGETASASPIFQKYTGKGTEGGWETVGEQRPMLTIKQSVAALEKQLKDMNTQIKNIESRLAQPTSATYTDIDRDLDTRRKTDLLQKLGKINSKLAEEESKVSPEESAKERFYLTK